MDAIILPITTIQPTFYDVIKDVDDGIVPSEVFWVSCYKTALPSVHAKVEASLDEADRNFVHLTTQRGTDVQVRKAASKKYTVECPSLGILPTPVVLASQLYTDPDRSSPQHPHRITSFALASDNSQFATGYLDGTIHLYPTTTSSNTESSISARQTAKGAHLSTVTSLQFFPSSRVLLSSGADFALHIFPAEPSNEPKSFSSVQLLRGHTRLISATGIIARGRNVLSSSQDGTIRLWDVGSAAQIRMMTAGRGKFTPINALSVGVVGQSNFHRRKPHGEEIVHEEPVSLHEKEVETSDKLVFCALSDGRFEVYDLRTKSSVYLSKAPSRSRAGLTAISYDANRQILATGSMDGVVSLYDTRNLSQEDVPDGSEVLTSFVRNPTPVEDLSIIAREGELDLAVATADGLPYVVSVAPNGPVISAELVGSDCDAVRAVKADTSGTFVWSAGDDSIVRKYELW